jgi:polyisoprenoid-binding protein YceI
MKTPVVLLALIGCELLNGAPDAFRLAPSAQSDVSLYVDKTGLLKGKQHHFVFLRYNGTLELERSEPAQSRVSFTIEAASIECRDTWVSASDLRKIRAVALEDMLAAGKHPVISFRSTGVRSAGPNRFDVGGVLSIRGIEQPVCIEVELGPGDVVTGKAVVKLTAFGLKPPTAALGLVGTKDEMTFTFRLDLQDLRALRGISE